MSLDLADDRRHGVRAEVDAAPPVIPVGGVDQADRADLDEIVETLAAVRESSCERLDEREVLHDHAVAIPPLSPLGTGGVLRDEGGALPPLSQLVTRFCRNNRHRRFPMYSFTSPN